VGRDGGKNLIDRLSQQKNKNVLQKIKERRDIKFVEDTNRPFLLHDWEIPRVKFLWMVGMVTKRRKVQKKQLTLKKRGGEQPNGVQERGGLLGPKKDRDPSGDLTKVLHTT